MGGNNEFVGLKWEMQTQGPHMGVRPSQSQVGRKFQNIHRRGQRASGKSIFSFLAILRKGGSGEELKRKNEFAGRAKGPICAATRPRDPIPRAQFSPHTGEGAKILDRVLFPTKDKKREKLNAKK